jgi:hypothetical protein
MDSAQAIDLMKQISIVHIYGNLGDPNFLNKDGRDFDTTLEKRTIEKCVDGIKIMPEIGDSHSTLPEVHKLLVAAERIIFIGFSFHPVNVHRLKLAAKDNNGKIFGTVCGMKDGEISRVRQTLRKYGVQDTKLHDLDALNFLRETNYL